MIWTPVDDSFARAEQYFAEGQIERAIQQFHEALALFQSYEQPDEVVKYEAAINTIADFYYLAAIKWRHQPSMCEQASELFLRAGLLYKLSQNEDGLKRLRILLNAIQIEGLLLEEANEFDQRAYNNWELAEQGYLEALDGRSAYECQEHRGRLIDAEARFRLRVNEYDEENFVPNEEAIKAAKQRFNQGVALMTKEQFDEAIMEFEVAQSLFEQYSQWIDAAGCHFSRGAVLYGKGQFKAAIEAYSKALKLFRKYEQWINVATCFLNRSGVWNDLKAFDESIEDLKLAQSLFEHYSQWHGVAACYVSRGNAHTAKGELDEAIKEYNAALPIFELYSQLRDLAVCHLSLGKLLIDKGEFNNAIKSIDTAQLIFEQHEGRIAVARCQLNRGAAHSEMGQPQQAIAEYDKAIHLLEVARTQLNNPADRISFLEQFNPAYSGAVKASLALQDQARAFAYLEQSRSQTLVEEMLRRQEPDSEDIGPDLFRQYHGLRLRLQQILRPSQPTEVNSSNSPTRFADTSALAQAQHDQREWEAQVMKLKPQSRYADVLRRLHRLREKPDGFNTAQGLLPDDRSAILSLTTWGEADQLVIFMVTKNAGLQTITFAPKTMPELRRVFAEYAEIYSPEKDIKFVLSRVDAMCRALGQYVFNAPVQVKNAEGQLIADNSTTLRQHLQTVLGNGEARLYIIPQDIFSLMPWAAACWEQDGDTRYLIEDYALHVVPGVEVMQMMRERKHKQNGHRRALIVGNPDTPNPDQSLKHAEAEAKYVADLLLEQGWDQAEMDILLTKDATKQNFLHGNKNKGTVGLYKRERGYTLVHLSMHATYDFRSRTGMLVLCKESDNSQVEHDFCFDYEIANAQMPAECVVNSACLTFTQKPNAIEYDGLAAAFILAGAETYIGTVFSVNDEATRKLMERLHNNHWSEKLSWSASLRAAQLGMLRSKEKIVCKVKVRDTKNPLLDNAKVTEFKFKEEEIAVAHPYCWAGFISCSL